MAEYDSGSVQVFQSQIIDCVREMERMLDRDVIAYYGADGVDNAGDAHENLRGLHKYLRDAYRSLGRMLNEIERRPEFN